MSFEQQVMGSIPLHEAASFFVGMKSFPASPEQLKTAAVKLKSASEGLNKMLAGEMPEGKAGRFKPVSQIKEASAKNQRKQVAEFYLNRMKTAAAKLGFSTGGPAPGMGDPEANMEGGQPTAAASNLPAMGGPMAPPSGPVQDPVAAKPTTQTTVPVHYMGAELVAQAAQRANETGFLRERLNAATEQNGALTQQVQEMQAQLEQLNQTSQAAGDQIAMAADEAVSASERALQHSMQAANMRIGIQKMREAMMELASQDPESMGTLAQQQSMQEEQAMQQQVDAGAGTPGQTATPPTGSGTPSAGATGAGGPESGGSSESGSSSSKPGTSVSIKTGGALATLGGPAASAARGAMPYVVPGAMMGAGLAAMQARKQSTQVPAAQTQVDSISEEQAAGSFTKALELMKAKKQLAENQMAEQHPGKNMLRSAAGGAISGGLLGHAVHGLVNQIK